MTDFILHIYDIFGRHKAILWLLLAILTAAAAIGTLSLSYKEDISDFLPMDTRCRTALEVYQQVSGANRIYAVIGKLADSDVETEADSLVAALLTFADAVERLDSLGYVASTVTGIDTEALDQVMQAVYSGIPFYLSDADYARADSLLSSPGYVAKRLTEVRQLLMLPGASVSAGAVTHDPLGLFTPVLDRLSQSAAPVQLDTRDGYLLAPDHSRAVIILESAFGSRESDGNSRLLALLQQAAQLTQSLHPDIEVRLTGGPAIAAGNARQIKSDSLLALGIALLLILALLIYVFRSARNILLILLSVAWGWLFALGCIALFRDSVSVIVIGIASVVVGIAVNYPLHLIDHLAASSDTRAALREIVSPLVVGNVTTVGAFLCLVPLSSPALRDLGIFGSLMLAGTVIFVLIFLPHLVKTLPAGTSEAEPRGFIGRLAAISPSRSRAAVLAVVVITCFLGYYAMRTEFDSDLRNINYITDGQRDDLAWFEALASGGHAGESLYLVSSAASLDEALTANESAASVIDSLAAAGSVQRADISASFLRSQSRRTESLSRWRSLIDTHASLLADTLAAETARAGFSDGAFLPFLNIIAADYQSLTDSLDTPLTSTILARNILRDADGTVSVVQTLEVPVGQAAEVSQLLNSRSQGRWFAFDVRSMNGSIASTLSADFNYIGIACGAIVFLFLWLSFGRIELAITAFLPMAVSWVWILGLMSLTGLSFNIVNIILATFIFGQGDDYTIFITEGLTYEFAYGRKVLRSYKASIIVSALIMFAGIGTLVIARHPALRSLGEVTVVGMMSVVIMAWLIPPLLFNFLVRDRRGRLRRTPLTLAALLRPLRHKRTPSLQTLIYGRYIYKGRDIAAQARRNLRTLMPRLPQLQSLSTPDGVIHITIDNPDSQGEEALLIALLHPDKTIRATIPNPHTRALLQTAATNFTPNLHLQSH
ncbi:MAG: MMPL family transporter [Candidatus Amulumruptor caecigallinarius]|nr:MMPL family transporter [Candidatus Amulumruptor caecigallinarius]MCM1396362.1 MMPL family transporter [Candidatus Amulumruptor caecigallinarius]MCM1453696.1 MMPL family transporter [bacterium]